MVAALFSLLNAKSNKLLVVHTFYLYQHHLVDFFLATQEDFNHVVSLVFSLFSANSGNIDDNAVRVQ